MIFWHFDCMILTNNLKSLIMKFLKNAIAALFLSAFFTSCLPHPGKRPTPPGHDRKVEELKERHPGNR